MTRKPIDGSAEFDYTGIVENRTMTKKLLVVVDIQKEIAAKGRPYFIENLGESLENARKLLEHARQKDWEIFHIQHLQPGDLYGYDSPLSAFIEGFEPKDGETLFTKSNYSCFSSPDFAEAMKNHSSDEIVIIGYGSTKCVLATIIEGYHRDYRFSLASDATGAQATETGDARAMHRSAVQILTSYCKVTQSSDVLSARETHSP